jgi:hypothetical protein
VDFGHFEMSGFNFRTLRADGAIGKLTSWQIFGCDQCFGSLVSLWQTYCRMFCPEVLLATINEKTALPTRRDLNREVQLLVWIENLVHEISVCKRVKVSLGLL